MKKNILIAILSILILSEFVFAQDSKPVSAQTGKAEQLIKLHDMLKSGIITQEQFDGLKGDLLNNEVENINGNNLIPEKHTSFKIEEIPGGEFKYVKPGEFRMGNNSGHAHEAPEHKVTISRHFWVLDRKISYKEFEEVTKSYVDHQSISIHRASVKPDYFKLTGLFLHQEANRFCEVLNSKYKLPDGYEFRLLTEAEWEYLFSNQSGITEKKMVEQGNGRYSQVMTIKLQGLLWEQNSKSPSNGLEWCLDAASSKTGWTSIKILSPLYTKGAKVDPVSTGGDLNISRGGFNAKKYDSGIFLITARYTGVDSQSIRDKKKYAGVRAALAPVKESLNPVD